MTLAVRPPLAPMLGKLARELPLDGYRYEPKWDGFRCLAFRSADQVELRSRHDRPLGRYFPELVEALRAIPDESFVLDGEVVVTGPGGLDFSALMNRLHPADSRVERLSAATPATFIAFDLLARGDEDLRGRPFAERRRRLEGLTIPAGARVRLTPATADSRVAAGWLERFRGAGVDGVMAKRPDSPYQPGARAMVKVKKERTAECVVAGFRLLADEPPQVSSLLLGLYDEAEELAHIGVVTTFRRRRRAELLEELIPRIVPLEGHPWEHGFLVSGSPIGRLKGAAARWSPGEMELDWAPVSPALVCEVAYDHLDSGRLRHPARFRRWRPDREASSCTFSQLESSESDPAALLAVR